MHGGDWVAQVLKAQGVEFVFTLTGGHISPILTASKARGIRVIDTRHEVNAVFAADAVARLTGVPGVAVVTAGPGVTNTLTAVKNAQMAQSPVVLIGGAAATALKGRGALQDIEQIPLFKSVVKWSKAVKRVKDIVPSLEEAFRQAQDGVPGPVFVELPVDLLYGEEIVREWYGIKSSGGKSLGARAVQGYLKFHARRLFAGADGQRVSAKFAPAVPMPDERQNSGRPQPASPRPNALCCWWAARPCSPWRPWIRWPPRWKNWASRSISPAWPGGCWAGTTPCRCVTSGATPSRKPTA